MECTLCQSPDLIELPANSSWHCQNCDLIFKDAKAHQSFEVQKLRYDTHNNNLEDPGYIKYFEQMLLALDPYLQNLKIRRGLDWGSGPQPVLRELLKRREVEMDIYDPIYQNFLEILDESYPLLTCTEVIEHFMEPTKSFVQMCEYLADGGVFAGLTQFHQGPDHFSTWWYARDPTHFCFYSEKTLRWIGNFLNLEILLAQSPIFIFRKN